MVTILTVAPVAFSNPLITESAVLFEFCAAQIVSVVPVRSAVCEGQVTEPEPVVVPDPGSLQPVRSAAVTAATATAPFHACFMFVLGVRCSSSGGAARCSWFTPTAPSG